MLASTCLDRAQRTLDFDRSTVGIPGLESTNLLTVVNAGVKEYFASFENSGEPPTLLKKETGYTLVADTAVNNASGVASGATSIIVDDSSGFGSSGALAIWDNDSPEHCWFCARQVTPCDVEMVMAKEWQAAEECIPAEESTTPTARERWWKR